MPRLDFWFRLFHHAALGLASVCLLYAEAFFLPGPLLLSLYFLAGLQVLAFGVDGRRWVLPGWVANLLAGAVAGGGGAWIWMELYTPDSVLSDLPWPAGLLPYIGPLLIGLLVVKLFRPRTPRDFWLMQGVGALQVALACVLATNPQSGLLFGVLLVAYVAFTLGCLALRHFQEEQNKEPARPADRLPFAFRMAPFCLLWTLAVTALATPLFLLTPRIDAPSWDSSALAVAGPHGEAGSRVGYSQTIDLNRGGDVRLGGEVVFRVNVVVAPGEAVPTLPPDQRWRGGVLDNYVDGRWTNEEMRQQMDLGIGRRLPPPLAPPLGPGRYRLDFTVGPHAGGAFLAEPVHRGGAAESDHPTRVDQIDGPDKISPMVVYLRGPVLPLLNLGPHESHYRQTVYAADDPDRSAPEEYDLIYDEGLKGEAVRGLAEWTDVLLKRLAADPASGLSAADVTRVVPEAPPPPPLGAPAVPRAPAAIPLSPPPPPGGSPLPPRADALGPPPGMRPRSALPATGREKVGRALATYLARSGVYSYTLDLRRQDTRIDPVMDFLTNVKAGHCERFASALALMLRSEGIPSRVVVGFRNAGERSEDGGYVVRAESGPRLGGNAGPVARAADGRRPGGRAAPAARRVADAGPDAGFRRAGVGAVLALGVVAGRPADRRGIVGRPDRPLRRRPAGRSVGRPAIAAGAGRAGRLRPGPARAGCGRRTGLRGPPPPPKDARRRSPGCVPGRGRLRPAAGAARAPRRPASGGRSDAPRVRGRRPAVPGGAALGRRLRGPAG